ncbi:hypothetical protein MD484_g6753, partial [Candolleomyces efflorescens]
MSSGSRFAQHLHTNYIPSTGEISHIRSLVDERQKAVDALNKEIEALIQRRDEHTKFVEEHLALLSPVRRVPDDILSLIFLSCLPRNSPARKATRLSGDHPALVISRVCQRWRHLSLNTPLLWTVIDIQIPWLPDPQQYRWNDAMTQWGEQMQAIFTTTQLWITRSASCPLTVSFSGGFNFAEDTDLSVEPVLAARARMLSIVNALCAVSCRWKSVYLSLQMGINAAIDAFFQIPPDKTPLLETLYVNTLLCSPHFIHPPPQREQLSELMTGRALVKAPRLRRFGVGSLWSSPLPLPIKWHDLTELSLGPVIFEGDKFSPLSILVMCINLTRCTIDHQGSDGSLPGSLENATTSAGSSHTRSSGVCHLSRLRTLELRGFEPPPSFAASVDFPSLRELIVLCSQSRSAGEGLGGGIVELVRKFGDGLTDVLLEWDLLTAPRLLEILRNLPDVINLKIGGGHLFMHRSFDDHRHPLIFDSVLEKLTPQWEDDENAVVGGMCYCPKLKRFWSNVKESVEFSEEAFARFVAGRRNRLSTDFGLLTSFVVALPSCKPTQLIRGRLEEMGVDLEDMVLITAYKKTQAWQHKALVEDHEYDVDEETRSNEDYINAVGPFMQTLGDLTIM